MKLTGKCVVVFVWLLTSFSSQALDKIKVGYVSFTGDVTTFIAFKKGFFLEQNLDVELVHNKAGIDSLRQLVNGQVDIGSVAPTPIIHSILGHNDIQDEFRIVARISESTNVNYLIILDTEKTPSIKDLVGKNVAITLGTDSEFFWHNMASAFGLQEEAVKFVDTAVPQMKTLTNGTDIAAVICWSPFHEQVIANLSSQYKIYSGDAYYTSSWLMVTSPQMIKRKPSIVTRYLKAMMKAEALLLEDPAQVAQLHSQLVKISPDILLQRYADSYYELSLSESLILNLSLQGDWVASKHKLNKTLPELRTYFEPKFLEKVKPGSVSLLE